MLNVSFGGWRFEREDGGTLKLPEAVNRSVVTSRDVNKYVTDASDRETEEQCTQQQNTATLQQCERNYSQQTSRQLFAVSLKSGNPALRATSH